MNRAIAKQIMTDSTHQIPSQLQTGRDKGMQLLDQALLEAVERRLVDPDDAFTYAIDKSVLLKHVADTTMISKVDMTLTTTAPKTVT